MSRHTLPDPGSMIPQFAGNPGMIAGWVRWLRAGGQLDEWADNTHAEVLFASQALLLQPTSQVLNLGCGWGRHALALANAGLRVIGL
jgi:2-polyprenyl-3-methyl-5-hydroxy-6-metoxy-1,4-benzoquinol methylase